MTNMLETTVQSGTLRYARSLVGGFDQPTAGKTGTTQNWADAWTVGFTPYYTTAVWMGFDQGGTNSLGVNQTGAVTTGPVWAQYMKEIHEGLPPGEFVRPEGIVEQEVTARSGLLPPAGYTGRTIQEVFLAGTQPTTFDSLEEFERNQRPVLVNRLREDINTANYSLTSAEDELFTLDIDLDLTADLDAGMDLELPFDGESGTALGTDTGEDESSNPLLD